MKKIWYFIPAILLLALDAMVLILDMDFIPLQHILWLALFGLAGFLLARGHFWGAGFGLMPAIEFIHMSTVHTGQVIDIELPLGVFLIIYYAVCALLAYRKGKV